MFLSSHCSPEWAKACMSESVGTADQLLVTSDCSGLWVLSEIHGHWGFGFSLSLPADLERHCLLSSVQSLSHVQLFVTPWATAYQASLSITNSQSLFKLMSIKLIMASNHLILCCPLCLLPSIFPSIRVFSNESVLRIRGQSIGVSVQSFQWIFRTDFL